MNFGKMPVRKCNTKEDSDEEEDFAKQFNIHYEFNNVYFYEDITKETIYHFIKIFNEAVRKVMIMNIDYGTEIGISIHIHSDGGDAFSGLGAMDAIKNCKVHTTTIADGFVASAATFMLLAGDEVVVHKNSTLLIHQMSTSFWGRYEDLKDEMENSNSIMEIIKGIYSENTSIPKTVLKQLMTREIYIDSQSALKWKIAHKVI